MSTKIQINSLEALERLIGGDSELEMEIRNSVAQDFAEKYLKSLVRDESSQIIMAVNDIKRNANDVFNEVASREIANVKTEWGKHTYTLKPSVVEDIKIRVRSEVESVVRELTGKELENQKTTLETLVKRYMDYNVGELVKKLAREKMESALK